MKRQPTVKSNYNAKEIFSFDKTPNEFRTITEKSINDIKEYCSNIIAEKYNGTYDAGALYAMTRTVIGNFDLLSSRLKDDYSCRKGKLKSAQNNGIRQARNLLSNFEKMVADREMALRRYSDNLREYNGYMIDEDLSYSKDKLKNLKKRLTIIEEKNREA